MKSPGYLLAAVAFFNVACEPTITFKPLPPGLYETIDKQWQCRADQTVVCYQQLPPRAMFADNNNDGFFDGWKQGCMELRTRNAYTQDSAVYSAIPIDPPGLSTACYVRWLTRAHPDVTEKQQEFSDIERRLRPVRVPDRTP